MGRRDSAVYNIYRRRVRKPKIDAAKTFLPCAAKIGVMDGNDPETGSLYLLENEGMEREKERRGPAPRRQ